MSELKGRSSVHRDKWAVALRPRSTLLLGLLVLGGEEAQLDDAGLVHWTDRDGQPLHVVFPGAALRRQTRCRRSATRGTPCAAPLRTPANRPLTSGRVGPATPASFRRSRRPAASHACQEPALTMHGLGPTVPIAIVELCGTEQGGSHGRDETIVVDLPRGDRSTLVGAAAAFAAVSGSTSVAAPAATGRWVAGDMHNHTFLSDGKRTEAAVRKCANQVRTGLARHGRPRRALALRPDRQENAGHGPRLVCHEGVDGRLAQPQGPGVAAAAEPTAELPRQDHHRGRGVVRAGDEG